MGGHGTPCPDDEAENPWRKVAEYMAAVHQQGRGDDVTGVSDEEYNTWRTIPQGPPGALRPPWWRVRERLTWWATDHHRRTTRLTTPNRDAV